MTSIPAEPMWPDEYESFREEAKSMAEAVVRFLANDEHSTLEERRRRTASLEVESEAGRDEVIAGVGCRVFGTGERRATYLHFHGGGMTLGTPVLDDMANADLAERLEIDIVSVDYRLAPEHPHPAGSDDCLAVARHLIELDQRPLLIGGESAGGYFASQTLLRARDELGVVDRFVGANLVFGAYDMSMNASKSGIRPSSIPDMLSPDEMEMITEVYLPGRSCRELRSPEVSPLHADLRNMPPAIFTVGTADHLLDDTLFMAARWRVFGNRSELAIYPDCIHGFLGFPMELATRARDRCIEFLGDCLD